MSVLVEPQAFPEAAHKALHSVFEQLQGLTFEAAMNILVNIIVKLTIDYGNADFDFLRKFLDDHIASHMAARRQQQGGARMSISVEVIDMTMDDSEIEVQNDMFERIMEVCGGNPTRRVLQVLADALACVAVNTGEPLDALLDGIKLTYKDALPKDGREN